MIKVNNIFKSFKEEDVLKNVTFDFEKGAIVGFLGPNGAGKSTLIKILTGVISPDKGTIYINNNDITENKNITKTRLSKISCKIPLLCARIAMVLHLNFPKP